MKRAAIGTVFMAALMPAVWGTPSPLYQNTGDVEAPPQIAPTVDATSFVNTGLFNISNSVIVGVLQGDGVIQNVDYYETSDTVNYTNNNEMGSNTGFLFDYFAQGAGGNGTNKMAANFVNNGAIFAGTVTNTQTTNNFFQILGAVEADFTTIAFFVVPSQIKVLATNLVNPGLLEVGVAGRLSLQGNTVDLTRGIERVESLNDVPGTVFTNGFGGLFGFFGVPLFMNNSGMFDQFWNVDGDLTGNPNLTLPNPSSPLEFVQDVDQGAITTTIQAPNASASVFFTQLAPSNFLTQVVFLSNTNPAISTAVKFENRFFGSVPTIQWSSLVTNVFGTVLTNTLYLQDTLAVDGFSFLFQNGSFGVPPAAIQATFKPSNLTFSKGAPADGVNFTNMANANETFQPSTLGPFGFGVSSVYDVKLSPIDYKLMPGLPGVTLTNVPGRIEVTANKVLNLTRARIDGANYMSLTATNHYVGSPKAQISVPFVDLNLASTNGTLSISNLLAPVIPVMTGNVGCWSAEWTSIDPFTKFTNNYHVLIASSALTASTSTTIQNAVLSTGTNAIGNIYISDVMNIISNAQFTTRCLTITTNPAGSPTAAGALNLKSQNILWSGTLPILQSLTNYGGISTMNSAYFAGARQPPFYNTTFDEAYQTFVNHGTISTAGSFFWANYFENSGSGTVTNGASVSTNLASIVTSTGNITVQATGKAVLSNAVMNAPGLFQGVSISCNDLVVTNHNILAGAALTLQVNNSINAMAGGATATNYWQAGGGFNLNAPAPASGDLLATTVTNITGNISGDVMNTWAAADRGCTTAGFVNDVAVGHLILDATTPNGVFSFVGATGGNAIYVDLLELRDYATNRDGNGDFPALDIDPSIKIYYADAQVAGGLDISEKANGQNGGQLCWVSNYNAGIFSSTNITYPDGHTYSFNRALATSPDIDSDGDGIPNLYDSTPFLEPSTVVMSVKMTNNPPKSVLVSWMSPALATNTLYFRTNLTGGSWSVLTNFVQGSKPGKVTVTDHQKTNAPCLYRVQVSLPQ